MDRPRRRVLRLLAALPAVTLGGCLSELPGTTGPRNPPEPDRERPVKSGETVVIASFDVERANDGTLRVVGRVRNDGDRRATRRVFADVTADGETTTAGTDVTIPGGETADFDIETTVSFEAFQRGGSVNVRLG